MATAAGYADGFLVASGIALLGFVIAAAVFRTTRAPQAAQVATENAA